MGWRVLRIPIFLNMSRFGFVILCCVWLLSILGCGGGGGGIPVTMTLTVNAYTPGQTSLSWTAHTGSVAGYEVYRNGARLNVSLLSATFLDDYNLQPNTQYFYVVYTEEIAQMLERRVSPSKAGRLV